jgi:hypothetical protein
METRAAQCFQVTLNMSDAAFDARIMSLLSQRRFCACSSRCGVAPFAAINRTFSWACYLGPDAAAASAAAAPQRAALHYSGFSAPGRSTLSLAVVDVPLPDRRHQSEALTHLLRQWRRGKHPLASQHPHVNSTGTVEPLC